jgi:hypothetical protein
MQFNLRRARSEGRPIGAAGTHALTRGSLHVEEARDESLRRIVRTARLEAVAGQGGEPIPPLRDVVLLGWKGVITLTGYEAIEDHRLSHPTLYQQTWILAPAECDDLQRADRNITRLIARLRLAGVRVQMMPGGEMFIPGEQPLDPFI